MRTSPPPAKPQRRRHGPCIAGFFQAASICASGSQHGLSILRSNQGPSGSHPPNARRPSARNDYDSVPAIPASVSCTPAQPTPGATPTSARSTSSPPSLPASRTIPASVPLSITMASAAAAPCQTPPLISFSRTGCSVASNESAPPISQRTGTEIWQIW